MSTIKLVIVDDHKIIREGLIAIFNDVPDITVVGNAESGEVLIERLNDIEVDVVLLDMHMPVKNGIDVTRELKAINPDIKILINTMSELPHEIEGAVAAGVDGYVLKTTGTDELVKAIRMVAHGSTYYGTEVISSFVKAAEKKNDPNAPTPIEMKVLHLLHEEKSHQDIASLLDISDNTLSHHFKNMYRKYKVTTDIGLIKYALKERFVE
ncbi:response regulator transcription factor [soil metagenome]